MSTFRTYLWKECREQRTALIAVVVAVVLLACGAAAFVPKRVLAASFFPAFSCVTAVLIALLASGGELLTESRAGGLGWLERLPAAFGAPFRAKLVLHVATVLTAGLLGFALAFPAAWARDVSQEGLGDFVTWALFLGVALSSGWVFAASAWTSRSVLALLAAALTLAGLGFPLGYLVHEGYGFGAGEVLAAVALLSGGALASAWFAFAARRYGRGPGWSAGLGSFTALASFLPVWVWCGWQLHVRGSFDPALDDYVLEEAVVTEDERTAFVQAYHWTPGWGGSSAYHWILRIDLASGRVERLQGGPKARMYAVSTTDEDCVTREELVVEDECGAPEPSAAFSLAAGEPIGTLFVNRIPEVRCRELRGWIEDSAPFGWREMRDPFSGTLLVPNQLGLPPDAHVLTDLGKWYVISHDKGAFLLDPNERRLEPAEWLDEVAPVFGPRLTDGRFFASLWAGGIGLVDPERQTVTSALAREIPCMVHRFPLTDSRPFADGEPVLLTTYDEVFRFDETMQELVPQFFPDTHRPIRLAKDGSVFAYEWGSPVRIERFDLSTGSSETVFPRAD